MKEIHTPVKIYRLRAIYALCTLTVRHKQSKIEPRGNGLLSRMHRGSVPGDADFTLATIGTHTTKHVPV
jgi:hypothetical protein